MGTRAVDATGDRRSRKPGFFRTGVRGLIVAVACFGFIAWAGRSIWENQHPAIGAARGLRSSNPADRNFAFSDLVKLGPEDPDRVVPALIAALGDSDPDIRTSAAVGLGSIGRQLMRNNAAGDRVRDMVRALIGSLKDREPKVRAAAATALPTIAAGTRGGPAVIDLQAVNDALAAAIGDPDDEVCLAALHAMAAFGWVAPSGPPPALIAAMKDRSARHRSAAIEALARFECPLDPWLFSLLQAAEDDPDVRWACHLAFSRGNPPGFSAGAIPALVSALGSRSPIVRALAVRDLFPHAGDPRAAIAIPALLAILREPIEPELLRRTPWDPSVLAADLLAGLAPRTSSAGEVVAALAEVVWSGHGSRKASAARALGAFGPAAEPAVPALIRALRFVLDGTEESRLFWYGDEVTRALGQIAPGTKSADEALSALIEALDPRLDPRLDASLVQTQQAVIGAIPEFGADAARALARLRELRRSPYGALRAAAEKAVAVIEDAGPGQQDARRGPGKGPSGSAPGGET